MGFTKEVTIAGDPHVYRLSENLKRYTLTDLGFTTKNNGTFILERSLDATSPYNQGIKLKIMIKPDFSAFKMSTVTANGMQKANIFKREQDQPLVEQYHFIIDQLLEREVLVQE